MYKVKAKKDYKGNILKLTVPYDGKNVTTTFTKNMAEVEDQKHAELLAKVFNFVELVKTGNTTPPTT